ncbi:MAG: hypothetical protein ABR520_06045 [Mycobacteriales bacterium]|nr:hypothetical protein [Frankia sp.]
MRRVTTCALAMAAALGVAGCTSGSPSAQITPSPIVEPSPTPCPTPARMPKPIVWPAGVPRDMPKPPTAVIFKTQRQSNLTIVYLRTQTSLRDGVLFVLRALPAAGYVLGRGDAETIEAEAPFSRDNLRGLVKLLATQNCQTTWLFAVGSAAPAGNGPVLPGYHSPTPSSLPFGSSSP